MRSIKQLSIFMLILFLILSIVGFTYRDPVRETSIVQGLHIYIDIFNEVSYKDLRNYDTLYGKCGTSSLLSLREINSKPFKVAGPLRGKDLYIFYIAQIVEQYYPDVDPYIVMAVLEIESNYQSDIISSAGAVGLMQVIPTYHLKRATKYGLNDIWDPYTNIICGIDFLNELYQTYNTWNRALLGYNNSLTYVKHVLAKADILRGGNYFGEAASKNAGSS